MQGRVQELVLVVKARYAAAAAEGAVHPALEHVLWVQQLEAGALHRVVDQMPVQVEGHVGGGAQ